MPEYPDTITQAQYDEYTANWAALIESGDNDALRQAFLAPNGARFTFLNFSLDQVVALVTAHGVLSIKARFLLMPEGASGSRFSVALFAADTPAKNTADPLTPYYIPTPAPATTTQTVDPSSGPDTKIPRPEAVGRLTAWANTPASDFTTAIFTTDTGPLQGCNFEVSTLQDPLAAAPPYANKTLFLNLGLVQDPEPTANLVVYIGALGSRTQGSVKGLPGGDDYYNGGTLCPPNH